MMVNPESSYPDRRGSTKDAVVTIPPMIRMHRTRSLEKNVLFISIFSRNTNQHRIQPYRTTIFANWQAPISRQIWSDIPHPTKATADTLVNPVRKIPNPNRTLNPLEKDL